MLHRTALRRHAVRLWIRSILLLIGIAAVSPARSQTFFQRTLGPGGGPVSDLARSSNGHLFALAGPLYRSSDAGHRWVEVITAPAGLHGIAASPDGALYGFGYYNLLRSTDDGETWQGLEQAPQGWVDVSLVAGVLFAGTYSGLYRSTDDGATWTAASTPTVRTGAVVQTPDGALHVGANAELYRSDDAGLTWNLEASLPRTIWTLAARPGGGLYIAVEQRYDYDPSPDPGGLYVYDGASPPSFVAFTDQDLTSIVGRDDGTVFVGSAGTCGSFVCYGPGIHRSTDGGTSWTLVASALSPVDALIRGDGDALYAGTGMLGTDIGSYPAQRILQSSGDGTSWAPANRGLPHASTYDLAAGPGGRMFAAADATIFSTDDAGATWTAVGATPPVAWS